MATLPLLLALCDGLALCEGSPPDVSGFPCQRASGTEL